MLDAAFQNVDRFLQRHMALLCVVMLVCGLFAGEGAANMAPAIPWLFSVLTFNSGLGLHLRDLHCLRGKPWILPMHLAMLHLAAPLVMWGTGSLFFEPYAVMGFVFIAMMPMSVSSILWAGMFRANITLVTTLILMDVLFAPFLIPYALQLFSGTGVQLDPLGMLRGLFWMLFFPTILALISNRLSHGGVQRIAGNGLSMFSKAMMLFIFFINGGVTAPYFLDITPALFLLICMVIFVSALLFVLNYALGRLLFSAAEDVRAFMFGPSMRSLTTGMVISMTYFSPLTTFTVLIAMFVQQPMAALAGKFQTEVCCRM